MIELPTGDYISVSAIVLIFVKENTLVIRMNKSQLYFTFDDKETACAWRKRLIDEINSPIRTWTNK